MQRVNGNEEGEEGYGDTCVRLVLEQYSRRRTAWCEQDIYECLNWRIFVSPRTTWGLLYIFSLILEQGAKITLGDTELECIKATLPCMIWSRSKVSDRYVIWD